MKSPVYPGILRRFNKTLLLDFTYKFYNTNCDNKEETKKQQNFIESPEGQKGEEIMKKTLAMVLALGIAAAGLTACGGTQTAETTSSAASTAAAAASETATADSTAGTTQEKAETVEAKAPSAEGPITVVSREDGSGTRGAFIELFGIEEKNDAGEKVDNTTEDAEITNSTSVMMTTISGNKEAIGYISLGSLNDTVKAVKIDGAEATVDNIKSGSYKIARPFNIATKEGVSETAQDFIKFIMSEEGQKVVEDNGYISQGNEGAYTASSASGKVVIAGSSSVSPVMEKLKEAYTALNPDVTIEVQQSDSTTGMTSALEGVCDIGMASRELKESETGAGLTPTVIAMDGIAVVVNNESPVTELTSDNVKAIFTGEVTDWEDLQ